MEEVKYSEEIEKVINQKNTSCALFGSEECRLLNMETCGECPVGELKPDKQEQAKAALSRLLNAAPPEDVEPLYTSDTCLLCRSRNHKGGAECFALFDLKKDDPEGNWTIALGRKKLDVKGADMILPLQVSCCKKCRARYNRFAYIPTVAALLIAALGLILTTNSAVYKALFSVASWVPALCAVLAGALAFAAYFILKTVLAKAMKKRTRVNMLKLPGVKPLVERGFTEVNEKKFGVSQLVFSDKRREHGVYSRITETPEEHEHPQVCGIWPCEIPPEEDKQ